MVIRWTTSMGMTPLEGLVMGTRSGDIDPALVDVIAAKEGWTLTEVESLLNKQSGLLGLSGLTHDMRELLAEARENNDRRAKLAIAIYCYRIRKYIGSYLAAMGGADAIVFTGGIGENATEVRAQVLSGLEWLGVELDDERNAAVVGVRRGSDYKRRLAPASVGHTNGRRAVDRARYGAAGLEARGEVLSDDTGRPCGF